MGLQEAEQGGLFTFTEVFQLVDNILPAMLRVQAFCWWLAAILLSRIAWQTGCLPG
jgi:hypothetical protein